MTCFFISLLSEFECYLISQSAAAWRDTNHFVLLPGDTSWDIYTAQCPDTGPAPPDHDDTHSLHFNREGWLRGQARTLWSPAVIVKNNYYGNTAEWCSLGRSNHWLSYLICAACRDTEHLTLSQCYHHHVHLLHHLSHSHHRAPTSLGMMSDVRRQSLKLIIWLECLQCLQCLQCPSYGGGDQSSTCLASI